MVENKWTTVSISKETDELLNKIKETYGASKSFAVAKALEEKYGHLVKRGV